MIRLEFRIAKLQRFQTYISGKGKGGSASGGAGGGVKHHP